MKLYSNLIQSNLKIIDSRFFNKIKFKFKFFYPFKLNSQLHRIYLFFKSIFIYYITSTSNEQIVCDVGEDR